MESLFLVPLTIQKYNKFVCMSKINFLVNLLQQKKEIYNNILGLGNFKVDVLLFLSYSENDSMESMQLSLVN